MWSQAPAQTTYNLLGRILRVYMLYSTLPLSFILILQYFVDQRHLVAFSVVVQAYWRLKVDGSNIILSGDLAPPDECIKIGKSGKQTQYFKAERGNVLYFYS